MPLRSDSTNYFRAGQGPGSDGVIVNMALEPLSFFGGTPVAIQTAATAFVAGDSTSTMGAAINALNTALKNLHLTA